MKTHRQIIKAIDIQIYFGKSKSMSNKMLRRIRSSLNKELFQPITIKEFAIYYKVPVEDVIVVIISNDADTNKIVPKSEPAPMCDQPIYPNPPKDNQSTEPYQFQKRKW
jgi:hypothetical protein